MPRVKNIGSVKEVSRVPVGLHKFTISSIRWARKANNEQIANANGEMAIDIAFRDEKSRIFKHRFWLTDAAIWALENLTKALGFPVGIPVAAKELVGKQCFAIVAAEFFFDGNGLKRDMQKVPVMEKKLIPKFYPVIGSINPAFAGDPAKSGGVPSGDFLINKGVVMKEYMNEDDRGWMLLQCDQENVTLQPYHKTPKIVYEEVKKGKDSLLLNDDF